MPSEVIPCTANNRNIAVRLKLKSKQEPMYKERLDRENERLELEELEGFTFQGGSHYGKPVYKDYDEKSPESLDEKLNPKMLKKEVKYCIFAYRTLPRVFSELEDFGVIEETRSSIDDVHMTHNPYPELCLQQNYQLRQKSKSTGFSKTSVAKDGSLASPSNEINRKRRSESLILSGRRAALVEYPNDSEGILDGQRSVSAESITGVSKRDSNTGEVNVVTNISRRASFTTMNAIPESLHSQPRYYSLPRKLSLQVENQRSTSVMREKQQRNSVPNNSSYLRNFSLDNHTEMQWERLVARARSFQMISSKEPEAIISKQDKEHGEGRKLATETSEFRRKSVDVNSEELENKENVISDESTQRKKTQEKETCSIKHVDNTGDLHQVGIKDESNVSLKEDQVYLTVKNVPINHEINNEHLTSKNNRRYSLATVRPHQEVREKISGYSTHGALEYAKMLLGKIQTEGKSKSKKERLGDMSKALKMVLEELNRIEVPDQDLVSLFISLRAKIVSLKAELKAEEKNEQTQSDNKTGNKIAVRSKTLPRDRNGSESITPVHSRRFSWC